MNIYMYVRARSTSCDELLVRVMITSSPVIIIASVIIITGHVRETGSPTDVCNLQNLMNRNVRQRSLGQMHPVKIQISLRIRAV